MAADDRPEHTDEDRIKDMLDRLVEILRELPPDRQKAFEEYLREQVEKDREADDRGDPEEGN